MDKSEGMTPLKLFPMRTSDCRAVSPPILLGNEPMMLSKLKSTETTELPKHVTPDQEAAHGSEDGFHPERPVGHEVAA